MKIRKAKTTDIKHIHQLVNEFAKKEEMLPRSLNDLYDSIRDLYVYEDKGKIKGVCALHIMWDDLAEIRSLAVSKDLQGKGIGKRLLTTCIKEAKGLGIKRVFALTYQPEFSEKSGLRKLINQSSPEDMGRLPQMPEIP